MTFAMHAFLSEAIKSKYYLDSSPLLEISGNNYWLVGWMLLLNLRYGRFQIASVSHVRQVRRHSKKNQTTNQS
jgi:hypothetical protein